MDVAKRHRPRLILIGFGILQICISILATGCTSIVQPIQTIPAHRVPREFLAEPQASKVPIDFTRLRQLPPDEYLLDAEDVLGIYIGSILGDPDAAPPVSMNGPDSDLPPAIGYPVPVGEDGTISLPLIEPVPVKGLTLKQVERLLFDIYTGRNGGKKLLPEDQAKIIVTLMEKRTYEVVVIRQDNPVGGGGANFNILAQNQGAGFSRSDFSSRGYVVRLRAYKNDVLNALAETGGLPGVNAKAEVTILRGNTARWREREQQIRDWVKQYGNCKDPCFVPPPIPDDPNALRIPTRTYPGAIPDITQEDIILQEGDVVLVENRDTELYYTGGTLRGGQWPLPRDFDLDVLGAIAVAGGTIGANQNGGTGVSAISNGIVPPSDLIILRKIDGGGQIAINVDLVRAINDPRTRLLVKAGDTLILRYKPEEELVNFGIGTFFTYGIRQLFRN